MTDKDLAQARDYASRPASASAAAPETARRIIRHKAHPGLPGNWKSEKLRYGNYSLKVELPCINGLSAWFSVATFWEADEAERMMTEGARQESSEYATKFVNAVNERQQLVEALENAKRFVDKASGTAMGVAMSGDSHPNPDEVLMDLSREGMELSQSLRAALTATEA